MGVFKKISGRLLGANTEKEYRKKLAKQPKIPKQVKGGKAKRKAKEN